MNNQPPRHDAIFGTIKSFFNKYPWMIAVVFFGSLFGYNKFLDWRQIQDMKQLVSDFEQLEQDLERETGEDTAYLVANCGSLKEKFNSTAVCAIKFVSSKYEPSQHILYVAENLPRSIKKNKSCGAFKGTGFISSGDTSSIYTCTMVGIRPSAKKSIREYFRSIQ